MSVRSYGSMTPSRPMPPQRDDLAGCVGTDMARLHRIMGSKALLRMTIVNPARWVNAKTTPYCAFCTRKFRAFSRKHHCRSCGNVICHHCNRECDVQVGATSVDCIHVRVCFGCIDRAIRRDEDRESQDEYAESVVLNSDDAFGRPIGDFVNGRRHTKSEDAAYYSRVLDTASESSYGAPRSVRSARDDDMFDDEDMDSIMSGKARNVPDARTVADEWLAQDRGVNDEEEQTREHVLQAYHLYDPGRETEFNALCDLVCRSLECSVGAVAFLGPTTQWYKAKRGISASELPREIALCPKVMHELRPTVVLDLSKDDRFNENPLVTGKAHIRFYASAPIRDPVTKTVLGSVFAMDTQPKTVDTSKTEAILSYLARTAEDTVVGGSDSARGTSKPQRETVVLGGNTKPQRESVLARDRTHSSNSKHGGMERISPQEKVTRAPLERSLSERWRDQQQRSTESGATSKGKKHHRRSFAPREEQSVPEYYQSPPQMSSRSFSSRDKLTLADYVQSVPSMNRSTESYQNQRPLPDYIEPGSSMPQNTRSFRNQRPLPDYIEPASPMQQNTSSFHQQQQPLPDYLQPAPPMKNKSSGSFNQQPLPDYLQPAPPMKNKFSFQSSQRPLPDYLQSTPATKQTSYRPRDQALPDYMQPGPSRQSAPVFFQQQPNSTSYRQSSIPTKSHKSAARSQQASSSSGYAPSEDGYGRRNSVTSRSNSNPTPEYLDYEQQPTQRGPISLAYVQDEVPSKPRGPIMLHEPEDEPVGDFAQKTETPKKHHRHHHRRHVSPERSVLPSPMSEPADPRSRKSSTVSNSSIQPNRKSESATEMCKTLMQQITSTQELLAQYQDVASGTPKPTSSHASSEEVSREFLSSSSSSNSSSTSDQDEVDL